MSRTTSGPFSNDSGATWALSDGAGPPLGRHQPGASGSGDLAGPASVILQTLSPRRLDWYYELLEYSELHTVLDVAATLDGWPPAEHRQLRKELLRTVGELRAAKRIPRDQAFTYRLAAVLRDLLYAAGYTCHTEDVRVALDTRPDTVSLMYTIRALTREERTLSVQCLSLAARDLHYQESYEIGEGPWR